MGLLLRICDIILFIFSVIYSYRVILAVVGLLSHRRYKSAEKNHRYAVVIAARNENRVIGNLIDSIKNQDYPGELVTVFVVADNCSDDTAEIARAHGAVCYERFDNNHCTKGYALKFLFECIERDYGTKAFEGYFIFDADNVLKRDYITRMNEAFDAGEKTVVSYRNTKNINDSWLAAGYALHWIRTAKLEHCGRSLLGISGRIQGTGVLFSNEFVKDGWNYVSLTEDRAFSSVIVSEGISIAYQHDAQFYDEQPVSLRIALRQRLRWAKGNLQAFTETFFDLIKGIFCVKGAVNRFSCYDMLLYNLPVCVVTVPVKLVKSAVCVFLFIVSGNYAAGLIPLLLEIMKILIYEHFLSIFMGLALFFTERKRLIHVSVPKMLFYSLMFPLFGIIGDIVTIAAVFCKVTWKPIPHKADIGMKEIEQNINSRELLNK